MSLGGVAQLSDEFARALERHGELVEQFRVVALLALEVLIVFQGEAQELLSEREHPRLFQEFFLAHLGAEPVDGLEGVAEIGLARASLYCAVLRAATASRHCQVMPANPTTSAGASAPRSPAIAGLPGPLSQPLEGTDRASPDRPVGEEPVQIIGERLGILVAAGRIVLDRLEDDRLQVSRDLRVDRAGSRRYLGRDLKDQTIALGLVEGGTQGEQLVERQAEGIEVAPGVGLASKSLGGHIPERAQDVALLVRSSPSAMALASPKSATQTWP